MIGDNQENETIFKVVLVGDGGVGKTTFVQRHHTGEFRRQYWPTSGVDVTNIKFSTTKGIIKLNIWDTAGQEKLGGLREGYYIGAHAAILMFDVTSRTTYQNIPKWYKDIKRVCESTPIVMIGNKVDCKDRKIKAKNISFHRRRNIQYYDMSAKSNYQFEKPIIWILRQLLGDPNLQFQYCAITAPPSEPIAPEKIKLLEEELNQVDKCVLPDDEDEEFN